MKEVVTWRWEFGGLIAPISGVAAWILLAVVLAASVGLAWLSYGHSLRALGRGTRMLLVGLRSLLIVLILLCLANPVRTERKLLDPSADRRIAVVADRSDSMTTPDSDGRTRLSDAAEKWRTVLGRAGNFAKPQPYAFNRSLVAMDDFNDAVASGAGEADETRLYASLEQLIADPAAKSLEAIVCLTDGLDTTGASPAQLTAAARAVQVPLFFVAGRNRLQRDPFLHIRSLNIPSVTLPNSVFTVRAVIEAYSREARMLPVSLVRNGVVVSEATLKLPRGETLKLWDSEITTDAPGTMELELRVGVVAEGTARRVSTKVTERLATRVLFFQGAMDWGFRFYRDALAEDSGFDVTALFSPDVGVRMKTGRTDAPSSLPATVAELSQFNLVVLSNVSRSQLSLAQEMALLGYVRTGGGLLFILPDTDAAGEFAGSPLEAMLPVAFGRPLAESLDDRRARLFQEQMGGNVFASSEELFANEMQSQTFDVPLLDFEISPNTSLAKIFTEKAAKIEPKFTHSSVVRRVKAGAEILAASNAQNGGQPLIVAQAYGRGRATAMMTDMLWRWSLSEPSDAQTAHTFWQQLTVWLAQSAVGGLRFVDSFDNVQVNSPVSLRLETDAAKPPKVTLIAPDEKRTPLEVARDPDGLYRVVMTPGVIGGWTVLAEDAEGRSAQAKLEVTPAERLAEHHVRPPDLGRLRAIAEATGGELLRTTVPESWKRRQEVADPLMLSEKRTMLWNNGVLFSTMLGLYCAELLLRRRAQLL